MSLALRKVLALALTLKNFHIFGLGLEKKSLGLGLVN